MKRIGFTTMILCLLLSFPSCKKIKGKGDVVSADRTVSGYTGINAGIEGDIYFTVDSVYKLQILAQQNIIDIIETYADNNKLIIKVKDHYSFGAHDPIRINVSAPLVNYFNMSGSAIIHCQSEIISNQVGFTISGYGDIIAGAIFAENLNADISGSGNMQASGGSVNFEHLNVSGSGNVDFSLVPCDSVYATISGSGNIKVLGNKYLDGTISGSGSILYGGNPVVVSHISGSGTIGPL